MVFSRLSRFSVGFTGLSAYARTGVAARTNTHERAARNIVRRNVRGQRRRWTLGSVGEAPLTVVRHSAACEHGQLRGAHAERGVAGAARAAAPAAQGTVLPRPCLARLPVRFVSHAQELLEPYKYVAALEGKGVRTKLMHAFNAWLRIGDEQLAAIADVVGVLHNASLMIDDIEDGSRLRRGVPVCHAIYGVPNTINTANYMYVRRLVLPCAAACTGTSSQCKKCMFLVGPRRPRSS